MVRSCRAFTLILAVLAAGCGDDDDSGGGSIPFDELPGEIADVFCAELLPCFGPLQDTFLNGIDCVENFTAQFEDSELPRWQAAMDAGTLEYDPAAARACLEAFGSIGCDIPASRTPPECEDALHGNIALGDDCNASVECAGVAYCRFETECPGTCSELEAEGDPCNDDEECVDGTACQGGTCRTPAGEGDDCGAPGDPDCTLGFLCAGADEEAGTSGTCKSIEDVLVGGNGDPCDPLGEGTLCEDGLSCILDEIQVAPLELTWLCAGPVGSGEACKAGFPDQCPDTEMCDADLDAGQNEGTCVSLPDEGEPCAATPLAAGCAPGLACVAGECAQIGRIGDPCTADAGCYSGACDGDTCTAASACAFDG